MNVARVTQARTHVSALTCVVQNFRSEMELERSTAQNFRQWSARKRESIRTDSLIFDRFRALRPARQPNCAKYFCAAFASHHVNSGTKFCAHARDFYLRAAPTMHARRCKKSLFHRRYCNMRAMCAQLCSAFVYDDVACAVRVVARTYRAQRTSHTHVVQWSQ
jgi:hypothetical protein